MIKEFEGFESHAYPDPRTGYKPYTIGYGLTYWPDTGKSVQLGESCDRAKAERMLKLAIKKDFLPKLEKIPYWAELNKNQQGALLSFAWNLGADFYGTPGFSTISRVLRNKDYGNIHEALILYRNPGSNVEAGLLRRRKAEAQLFNSGWETEL